MNDRQQLALVRDAQRHLKRTRKGWLEPPVGKGTEWESAMEALNRLAKDLASAPPWAKVGPVTKPGASILDMDLTHATSGIPLFPAVDLAWGAGVPIYAPEAVVVDTKDTSANPGEALYLTGDSKLRYWIGHLDRDHPLGKRFSKGALLGRTVNQAEPREDHGHIGVNAEAFLGKGVQLKYGRTGNGPDYTRGSPTIREQLRRAWL